MDTYILKIKYRNELGVTQFVTLKEPVMDIDKELLAQASPAFIEAFGGGIVSAELIKISVLKVITLD